MAPATSVPPALPPSVEEAYRRKCIQLKQRTSEVEEANDAARLRLARLKRQVEKMRLERAFLLEQLVKRTSTNVEDSDGSPSPPPTPKEKPLRIKRGHRKPSAFPANLEAPSSINAATPGSTTFISQNLLVHSPSSDAYSAAQQGEGGKTNGVHKGAPKKPGSAFDLYCEDTRPSLKEKAKEGDSVEEELSSSWKELPESQRDEYKARADRRMADYQKDKDVYDAAKEKEAAAAASAKAAAAEGNDKAGSAESDQAAAEAGEGREAQQQPQQEDVEMTNYDTDQETQGERPEE
ncbi:hypothetical protein CHGG_03173 [Chaetomium globosum CBS 148.51]|uniref:HMG box domain-containing protein n=1 Tax=Chaetomium globosum (strain ATCC 6205 / CBS 148.51 / DSM 1962 / NBRC 6347 / NRRL 1970) TaxID=306901 RepID=Q2H9D1_CHAGB|nr:uncharacterized protein CHGG_03173 [Chaetomium globosum CBS 148.51]EAQ91238.1 hypothetical protein CHGG_03173 [Chaetomium globosum CBS 148.51]